MARRAHADRKHLSNSIRPWSKRAKVIACIVTVLLVTAVACVVATVLTTETLTIDEPCYISMTGSMMEWDSVFLAHEGDRTRARVNDDKKWQDLDRFPVVIPDKRTIALQRSMIWNERSSDRIHRIDYFGKILNEASGITLMRGKGYATGADGFLYDGEDTYIFLEDVTLSINGESLDIPKCTVVQVSYGNSINIYGTDIEPYYDYLGEEDVMAVFESGERLNLSTDKLFMAQGVWRLLFMPMDQLQPIEKGIE